MALPTIFDPSTCVRKGLCPVSKIRHQGPEILESHSLYYEQHGRGTTKVLFIMGLNSSSFSWAPQVEYFGHSTEHTVLVFDNRGVGNSGYPRGPYSTAAMTEDVIALLDHLEWTAKRELHIVGISLGGMIAQELATRIPERIVSILLGVTTPGGWPWNNLPPWNGFSALATLALTQDPAKKVPIIMDMIFPIAWLNSKAEDDPAGRTNRQIQSEAFIRRISISQPQRFMGHISQMAAGLTHHCAPDRLRLISSSIPKVVILTGDEDNLVLPQKSFKLKESMPEAELIQWKGTGHGIQAQWPKRFHELLEKTFKEGQEGLRTLT